MNHNQLKPFKLVPCWACKKGKVVFDKIQFISMVDYPYVMKKIDIYKCDNEKCNDTFIIQKDGTLKRWNL